MFDRILKSGLVAGEGERHDGHMKRRAVDAESGPGVTAVRNMC